MPRAGGRAGMHVRVRVLALACMSLNGPAASSSRTAVTPLETMFLSSKGPRVPKPDCRALRPYRVPMAVAGAEYT